MPEPVAPSAAPGVGDAGGTGYARSARFIAQRLVLGLVLGTTLVGCSIPFGNGGDPAPAYQSPEETRRDRNRLYIEEQERMERARAFDRIGPSDR